uniref:hypothetical protein n=1 Tax=Streptosporangium sp. CA-256172 TaxID=3240076 RepID=UPI003F4913A0
MSGYRQGGQPFSHGGVTEEERRLVAYRWASCLAERSWDTREVFRSVSWIERYLERAGDDRTEFNLREQCLEQQVINYGLHPLNRNPGERKLRPRKHHEDEVGLPDAEDLVKAAEHIVKYVLDL